MRRNKQRLYSITSSARAGRGGATSSPSASTQTINGNIQSEAANSKN